MDTKKLREERARVWGEMKEIVEKDDWSAEDRSKYEAAEKDLDRLTEDIERHERHASLQKDLEETPATPHIATAVPEDRKAPHAEQYAEAFNAWARSGMTGLNDEQRKVLRTGQVEERQPAAGQNVGTSADGGFLVPTGFQRELTEAQKAFGGVRNVARILTTDSGNDIEWPTEDDTSNTGELLAEAVAAAEQKVAWGQKTLKAYKYSSKVIRVSLELLNDSAFNLNSHLPGIAATRIARITNSHFTTGDNDGKPQGVVPFSSKGADAAAAAAIGYDDFVDLEHSVDLSYRPRASWMFADGTVKAAKKLKDQDGRPLWVPGIATSEPDTILSYRYTVNQDMTPVGAAAKSVLFGDFNYYVIRDIPSFTTVLRLTERYAEFGQVAFLTFTRHDGRGVAAESTTAVIKHLLHPAS